MQQTQTVDIVGVGGGLAGLTAAAYLARAGKRVLLCEKQCLPLSLISVTARHDITVLVIS